MMQAGTGRQLEIARARARGGFTLIELLVVIGIIAALTVIGIPAMRGLGRSNVTTSATQQLVDDLMLARHKAIVNRTTVHVVFVPPLRTQAAPPYLSGQFDREGKLWERLREGTFTTYAIYAERSLGDQPGQRHGRYLTEWRTLPEGVFVSTNEYANPANNFNTLGALDRAFGTNVAPFPFPTERSPATLNMPVISFDESGRCFQYELGSKVKRYREEYIELATGSVMTWRSGNNVETDARELPPGNGDSTIDSTNVYNRIRIDSMTGRARTERPEIVFGN